MRKKLMLALIAFILLAAPAGWLQLRDGVQLGERLYIRQNPDLYAAKHNSVSIERSGAGAMFIIQTENTELNVEMTKTEDFYSFRYEDGVVIEGFAGKWSDELVNKDGMPLGWTDGMAVYVGDEEPDDDILLRKHYLSNVLFRMHEGICTQKGHFLLLVIGFAMYALGVASILWPEKVHFFGIRWRYAQAELSADGIAMQKFSGAACIVMSIVMMYMPLFR